MNLTLTNQRKTAIDAVPPRLREVLTGEIEDIYVTMDNTFTTPNCHISFYHNDLLNTSSVTLVRLAGDEEFSQEFVTLGTNGSTNFWSAHVGGLSIPYHDDDKSGEFHFTFRNDGSAMENATIAFTWRPSFPV